MVILRATVSNIRFDHAIGAFEGRVHVVAPEGEEEIVARAYLPVGTKREEVEDALTHVARRRREALGKADDRD